MYFSLGLSFVKNLTILFDVDVNASILIIEYQIIFFLNYLMIFVPTTTSVEGPTCNMYRDGGF